MLSKIAFKELLETFVLYEHNIDSNIKPIVLVESINGSDIDFDVYCILEGLADLSHDKKQRLCRIQALQETLNPDFDDDDYEDPYADIWEAFVTQRIKNGAEYLMITSIF